MSDSVPTSHPARGRDPDRTVTAMTTHERAVEVAASPDDIFHLLSDPLNMPAYVDFVEDAAPAGPDTVRITTTDLGGAKRTGLLRAVPDRELMHVLWELDSPRCHGQIVVAPGPDADGWNTCIVRAMLDDENAWGDDPDIRHVRGPLELGGMPGHEGLALGEVGVGRTGPVDPKTEQLLGPDEVLERALAGLRDRVAVARGKVKAAH